jgi:hypothetical protein
MSWAEVTKDRIICHQGDLPRCGICGRGIMPTTAAIHSIGKVPLCAACRATADDDAEFNAWATRQIDRSRPSGPPK